MKLKAYKLKQNSIEHASDIKSYLELPKKDRLLWGFFYIYPKYLRFDSVEDFFKDGNFETEFDKYFKKKYPIQFFLRDIVPDFCGTVCYPLYLFKDEVKHYFFPRQRWLYKKIPNHWVSTENLIFTTIFESIVHYVDEECWFDEVDWDHNDELRETKRKIDRIYRWAKLRVKIDKKINEEFSDLWKIYRKILDSGDKHFAKMTIEISDNLH